MLLVSIIPPRFKLVLEGMESTTCASFSGDPPDRDVAIFFTLQSVTAEGINSCIH